MSETQKWWNETGFRKLNEILSGASPDWDIRLIGRNIGNVPLSNLMEVPSYVDFRELTEILQKEGLKAVLWMFNGNENDVDIIIRL